MSILSSNNIHTVHRMLQKILGLQTLINFNTAILLQRFDDNDDNEGGVNVNVVIVVVVMSVIGVSNVTEMPGNGATNLMVLTGNGGSYNGGASGLCMILLLLMTMVVLMAIITTVIVMVPHNCGTSDSCLKL